MELDTWIRESFETDTGRGLLDPSTYPTARLHEAIRQGHAELATLQEQLTQLEAEKSRLDALAADSDSEPGVKRGYRHRIRRLASRHEDRGRRYHIVSLHLGTLIAVSVVRRLVDRRNPNQSFVLAASAVDDEELAIAVRTTLNQFGLRPIDIESILVALGLPVQTTASGNDEHSFGKLAADWQSPDG